MRSGDGSETAFRIAGFSYLEKLRTVAFFRAFGIVLLCFTLISGCGKLPQSPQALYSQARMDHKQGHFAQAIDLARNGYTRFQNRPESDWYWKFKLLYAEMLLWNGDTEQAQALLTNAPPAKYASLLPRYEMLRAYVLFRKKDLDAAEKLLAIAEEEARKQGNFELVADIQLLPAPFLTDNAKIEVTCRRALTTAVRHRLRYQEAAAHLNLGMVQVSRSHFGDALPEFQQASSIAASAGASMLKLFALGDVALCNYNLGNYGEALETEFTLLPLQKEEGLATMLRESYLDIGNIYLAEKDNEKAIEYFRRAMAQVRKSDSPFAFAFISAAIAQALASAGSLDEAERYNREGLAICNKNDKDQLAALTLNQGLIAARRNQHQRAIEQFENAIALGQNVPSVLWQAYSGLALQQASLGNRAAANHSFEEALAIIDHNRSEQLITDYKITFLSQLIRFYNEYVDLLISEGETGRALEIADSSRAGVLAEDLAGKSEIRRGSMIPEIRRMAKQTHTVFLFYLLAPQRSYLWVIRDDGIKLVCLPPQQQIEQDVQSYNHFIQDEKRDPLTAPIPAAKRLFETLIAPAGIETASNVVLVPDGALDNLNFETLPVYDAPNPHYWLEDAVVSIAPSLSIIRAVRGHSPRAKSLLLMGDTVTAGTGMAPLPDAALEITEVSKRFAGQRIVSYIGAAATPGAYRAAHPERFSNIHFATHAEANARRPLDSAIVLSPQQNVWKLFARDVAEIPLNANLVTLSACRGAGSRTLSGEGLVGFAWAFFQAGARHVVTSLWDVNDRSTADLMNTFYGELAAGKSYARALRAAKLAALHGTYRKPYFWGPFQLYSRELSFAPPAHHASIQ